jgi:hypothetical protein
MMKDCCEFGDRNDAPTEANQGLDKSKHIFLHTTIGLSNNLNPRLPYLLSAQQQQYKLINNNPLHL